MKYIRLLALAFAAACGPLHCRDSEHCTRLCEDGAPANPKPPYCPLNDRDLLPPANDNVGLEGLKKEP